MSPLRLTAVAFVAADRRRPQGVVDWPRSRNQWLPLPASRRYNAVGGIRAEDEDAGRRASSLITLLLFRQLCEQSAKLNIPTFPIQGGFHRLDVATIRGSSRRLTPRADDTEPPLSRGDSVKMGS